MVKKGADQEMNWDLTSYFPAFNGPEMAQFKEALDSDTQDLLSRAKTLAPLVDDNVDAWEEVFLQCENLFTRLRHIGSYVGCLTAADARNEAYLKEEAALTLLYAEGSKLQNELLRGLKTASDGSFAALAGREALSDAGFFLGRMRREARYTMDSEREALAADLRVDGLSAWGRLYDTLSGKLEFEMRFPDERTEKLPISQRRSLMENPDRRVRQAAFEGGNAAWESVEDVAAAALNAISGTRLTLNRYREVPHFLEVALFQSAITRKTLDAMFEAIFSEVEVGRRILRFRAKAMDVEKVAWYDLGAPLPFPDVSPMDWEEGTRLVQGAFARAYPALGEFTQAMYDKRWIDYEPRAGKRPGGFCTGSSMIAESRIFMTYNRTMGDALTLAHEAGHAFHSHVMRDLRPFAQGYPMTLAESASTFAEMILADGVLSDPDVDDLQQAVGLDSEVGHAGAYLLDIPVRFEYEKALYEERGDGELTVSQLKALMTEKQRGVFGDVLQEGGEDSWFWASKLHFYITGVTFYNFPYTFGYLLSRGLFAMFKNEGPDFLPRYERFLRLTGSDTAEHVAKRSIGGNLEQPDFWVRAIRSLEEPLAQLELLLPRVFPAGDDGTSRGADG
ncbi:MAG: M3 family oligoendopeptidase [Candidatus Latescibacteria bacterium]|nr:M3 family oligoendopeptidase [Candidatus Latescibacterota bacterium]